MRLSFFTFALAALLLAPAMTADAQIPAEPPMRRMITVSGEGINRVVPDMAIVRFGVVTEHQNPEQARKRNAEAAAKAMNQVRALGVPERKIRLETVMLQPRREYIPATQRWRDLGYEAVRVVVVELEDLEKLPDLIAGVVQQGANRLDGVSYEHRDKDAVRNAALTAAVAAAREKAQLMTTAAGASLGRVMQINEMSFDYPRPMYRAAMAEMAVSKDASQPDAYAAGETEVRAVVQITFELQ